jgi:acyl CoA:acetate/3-ketoacid CoA transferase alpha subunit
LTIIDNIMILSEAAVADIFNGASVMIGDFGTDQLIVQGAGNLTVIALEGR